MSWNLNSKVSLIPILFWEYPKHKLVITQEMLNQHIQYICIFQVKDLIWLGFKKAFNKQINYTNIMYTYNHIWKSSYKQHEGSILAITHLLTLCSKTKVICMIWRNVCAIILIIHRLFIYFFFQYNDFLFFQFYIINTLYSLRILI